MQRFKLNTLDVNTKANIASVISWLAIVGPLAGSKAPSMPTALGIGVSAFWMLLALQAFGLAATGACLSGLQSDEPGRFTRSANALALTLARLDARTPLTLALGWVLSALLVAVGVYCGLLACVALYVSGAAMGRVQQLIMRRRLNGLGSLEQFAA